MDTEVILFLLVIFLFFSGYGLIRRVVVSRVARLMRRASDQVESEAPEVLHEKEKKASRDLQIEQYAQASDLRDLAGNWQTHYQQAKALFERYHRQVTAFSLLYFLLPFIPGVLWNTWPDSGVFSLVYFIVFIYWVNNRRKLRRFNAYFTNPPMEITEVKPSTDHTLILVLLVYFLASAAAFSLDGQVGADEAPDVPVFGYLLLGTLALHLLVFYLAKINNSGYPNLKLLILRVFGQKDQADMTFARLLTVWKHFGTYFTIVDPSYLNYR